MKWTRKRIKMADLETVFCRHTRKHKYDSNHERVELSAEEYRERLVSQVCSMGEARLDRIKEFLEGYEEGTLLSAYKSRDDVGIYRSNVMWLAVANEPKNMYDFHARLRGIANTYKRNQFFLDVDEIPKALGVIAEAKAGMGSYEDDRAYHESLRVLKKGIQVLEKDAKHDGWYDMTVMEIRGHMENDIRNAVFNGANVSSSFPSFSTQPCTYLLVDDGGQGRVKTYDEYLEGNPLMTDFHPRVSEELIARYEEMHRARYDRRHNYAQRWLKACEPLVSFLTI